MAEENWDQYERDYPSFRDWGESFHDNIDRRSAEPKDYDRLAILDFERAEEYYNYFLS